MVRVRLWLTDPKHFGNYQTPLLFKYPCTICNNPYKIFWDTTYNRQKAKSLYRLLRERLPVKGVFWVTAIPPDNVTHGVVGVKFWPASNCKWVFVIGRELLVYGLEVVMLLKGDDYLIEWNDWARQQQNRKIFIMLMISEDVQRMRFGMSGTISKTKISLSSCGTSMYKGAIKSRNLDSLLLPCVTTSVLLD
nr:unnamed protein product [Callosobruchus analis]